MIAGSAVVRDGSNLWSIGLVVDLTGDLHGLIVQIGLVQRLCVVESVVVDVRVELSQMLVTVGRVDKLIQLIVAVRQ